MKKKIAILCFTCLLACKQKPASFAAYLSQIKFDSTDITDIRALKDTTTGLPVIATAQTWKAWSIDVELPVSPGDTVDWLKMEVLFAE